MKRIYVAIVLLHSLIANGDGQALQKNITKNTQTWVSANTNIYLNTHWYLLADIHVRENNFFQSNSFIFGRIGLGYQINKQLSVAVGYGNLLAAPTVSGWRTKADEDRIYQQIQWSNSYKKLTLVNRIRNEQRWQSIIINDEATGENKFSNRVRYLLGGTLSIFKNHYAPQLVVSDEILLQFGKKIVYNTFDQNRLFIGIKQKISPGFAFDLGYMNVFQQRSNGSSYFINHTFRLFFYYTLLKEKK